MNVTPLPFRASLNRLQNHILNFLELSTNKYEIPLNGLPIEGRSDAFIFRNLNPITMAAGIYMHMHGIYVPHERWIF